MLPRYALAVVSVLFAGLATSCGGGGGGGGSTEVSFELASVDVPTGAVWRINRPIVFRFSQAVDFSSISSNTINIRSTGASQLPGVGSFRLLDSRTVQWQPTCPTLSDFSDAGLRPGGLTYEIEVKGTDSSGNAVSSALGFPLGTTQRRTFTTPTSNAAAAVFSDPRPEGPPVPIVRSLGSTLREASYLQIGPDPDSRVYFELDGTGNLVLSEPGFSLPLNLYSDPSSSVAAIIEFNQPVNPSNNNISVGRLQLEFLDGGANWQPLSTRPTLVSNCTESGARVKLEPIGVLPGASQVRVVIREGFQDIVGQSSTARQDTFAVAPTATLEFDFLDPIDALSDEFKEDFDFGGTGPRSFEDTTALFDTPTAEWAAGRLSAAFSFDGTGGPSGNFDWVVRANETFFFDTVSQEVIGGPGGIPSDRLIAIGGVVDVRNLTIEAGGEIRVQGPNPMRINATGQVRIAGLLDLGGFSAKDVATLNTGNQREIGGAGAAGGGRGGGANDNIAGSTPRGGPGQGPLGFGPLGGQGGSTGYNPEEPNKDKRRPGGGGGGRFARDVTGQVFGAGVSPAATAGIDGHPESRDATSGTTPALGGAAGAGPFTDLDTNNDFFGVRPIVQSGNLVGLIRGELSSLWGGYGGGGGGNASPFGLFPLPNWNLGSDEKGGGGGGGAGGVHVKALGPIVFGASGQIRALGGRGATGENTNFTDHIGGTGGSGSGGHVILESATYVDFTDGGANQSLSGTDYIVSGGPFGVRGPVQYVNNCCRNYSNGGAGGPGLVQIHVPDSIAPPGTSPVNSDIVVPASLAGSLSALDQIISPSPFQMIPTFGARSKVRSQWISIGGADQRPSGESLVRFLFAGTVKTPGDDEGKILRNGTSVADIQPLVFGVLEGSSTVSISTDGLTLRMSAPEVARIAQGTTSGISNDIYLRTPALLEDCVVRLGLQGNPLAFADFPITRATVDPGAPGPGDESLSLLVARSGPRTLQDFFDQNTAGGTVAYLIVPRFFSVVTDGIEHALPESAFVRILFQATKDNGIGLPASTPVVDWTADISKFNARPPGEIQFFRFEVEFDLDSMAEGVTAGTTPVTLDFLRVPFVF